MWYRYNRRGPRGMRYFWFLFIPLFFIGGGHAGFLGILLLWIAVTVVVLSLIGRAIFAAIVVRLNNNKISGISHAISSHINNRTSQISISNRISHTRQGYQQPYYQPRSSEESQASHQAQAPAATAV